MPEKEMASRPQLDTNGLFVTVNLGKSEISVNVPFLASFRTVIGWGSYKEQNTLHPFGGKSEFTI